MLVSLQLYIESNSIFEIGTTNLLYTAGKARQKVGVVPFLSCRLNG